MAICFLSFLNEFRFLFYLYDLLPNINVRVSLEIKSSLKIFDFQDPRKQSFRETGNSKRISKFTENLMKIKNFQEIQKIFDFLVSMIFQCTGKGYIYTLKGIVLPFPSIKFSNARNIYLRFSLACLEYS